MPITPFPPVVLQRWRSLSLRPTPVLACAGLQHSGMFSVLALSNSSFLAGETCLQVLRHPAERFPLTAWTGTWPEKGRARRGGCGQPGQRTAHEPSRCSCSLCSLGLMPARSFSSSSTPRTACWFLLLHVVRVKDLVLREGKGTLIFSGHFLGFEIILPCKIIWQHCLESVSCSQASGCGSAPWVLCQNLFCWGQGGCFLRVSPGVWWAESSSIPSQAGSSSA